VVSANGSLIGLDLLWGFELQALAVPVPFVL